MFSDTNITYSSIKKKKVILRTISFLLLLVVAYFSAEMCNVNKKGLLEGIEQGYQFLLQMFPPDWQVVTDMIYPSFETILIALLSTIFGFFISFFIALGGAANLSPVWLKNICRFIMAIERALPEIIIILLLIASLGLGAFPGVIALSIGCIGMLGRLFADAIEEIDHKVLESIEATGASKWQVVQYGVIPEILPSLISNTIFRFEVNIRLSVLLGAVGAGGIGYELYYSFQLLEYQKATMAIIIILLLIFFSERLSDYLRKKVWSVEKIK